ncbi:MAG: flagellar hook-length control protein FliK [Oleiphilaceae bacterium]
MTQTVLPQTPAPGMQSDAGPSKTGSGRDSSASESRYDSVSRAEQKRLDQKQSERSDKARQADAKNAKNEDSAQPANQAGSGRKASESGKGGKTGAKGEGQVAENNAGNKNPETAADMEATTTPLTFAELQALLHPATGSGANSPGLAPGTELFARLIGGKPGQSSAGGLPLMDALMPAAGQKAGAIDPSSLLTGTRFESTLDLVSQQGANATGKLAAEAQVPLRGYTTSLDVPVNHAEWGDKLMGKLSWLTAKNLSVAEIHLTPPDMGPMEVRVRVQNDQANITVHAANPVVRDQLELHSHRLRDMLGEQGLDLARFDVSSNSQNQSGEQDGTEGDGSSPGSGSLQPGAENGDGDMQVGNLDLSWKGAVDIFA